MRETYIVAVPLARVRSIRPIRAHALEEQLQDERERAPGTQHAQQPLVEVTSEPPTRVPPR